MVKRTAFRAVKRPGLWQIQDPKPGASIWNFESGIGQGNGAKTQSRGTYSPSPPRRRGSSLDSRLRGNDGRCCFHAFMARLKPGPDTRLRPGRDTKRFGGSTARARPKGSITDDRFEVQNAAGRRKAAATEGGDARNFLHENEPKAIDNKADHKKRTQERTQFYSLNVS